MAIAQRIGRASSARAARRTTPTGSAVGAEQALELVALGEAEPGEGVPTVGGLQLARTVPAASPRSLPDPVRERITSPKITMPLEEFTARG